MCHLTGSSTFGSLLQGKEACFFQLVPLPSREGSLLLAQAHGTSGPAQPSTRPPTPPLSNPGARSPNYPPGLSQPPKGTQPTRSSQPGGMRLGHSSPKAKDWPVECHGRFRGLSSGGDQPTGQSTLPFMMLARAAGSQFLIL